MQTNGAAIRNKAKIAGTVTLPCSLGTGGASPNRSGAQLSRYRMPHKDRFWAGMPAGPDIIGRIKLSVVCYVVGSDVQNNISSLGVFK